MKNRLITTMAFIMLIYISDVNAQCPTVNPVYQDISNWLKPWNSADAVHYIVNVEVTYVSVPLSDGSHYFSAFGRALMDIDYGPCILKTNPAIYIIYSDRTYPHTVTVHEYTGVAKQPFSIAEPSEEWISLNMMNNSITVKSITYNFTSVYTNVTRSGNTIIGNNNGNLIILNLFKTSYSGNTRPSFYTIDK